MEKKHVREERPPLPPSPGLSSSPLAPAARQQSSSKTADSKVCPWENVFGRNTSCSLSCPSVPDLLLEVLFLFALEAGHTPASFRKSLLMSLLLTGHPTSSNGREGWRRDKQGPELDLEGAKGTAE